MDGSIDALLLEALMTVSLRMLTGGTTMARPHNPASTTTGESTSTRREFAAALGWTALTGVWGSRVTDAAESAALSADTPRALQPTGADLGSLLADVERIADRNRPADSFLSGTYRKLRRIPGAGPAAHL